MNGDDALKADLSINWVGGEYFFWRRKVYVAYTIRGFEKCTPRTQSNFRQTQLFQIFVVFVCV